MACILIPSDIALGGCRHMNRPSSRTAHPIREMYLHHRFAMSAYALACAAGSFSQNIVPLLPHKSGWRFRAWPGELLARGDNLGTSLAVCLLERFAQLVEQPRVLDA
jgi:hypothetical protein